ncbi:hypothetical protein CY35_18G066400 [Sphagnum magellanicum]|nr:hypothetical protein CY35_18G066400 [Sphagnum magellanicum]
MLPGADILLQLPFIQICRLFGIQWFQTLVQIYHTVSKVLTNFKLWRLQPLYKDSCCWLSLELEMKNKLAIGVERLHSGW